MHHLATHNREPAPVQSARNKCVWHMYHSGFRLSQWEMTLYCNVASHWLSSFPELYMCRCSCGYFAGFHQGFIMSCTWDELWDNIIGNIWGSHHVVWSTSRRRWQWGGSSTHGRCQFWSYEITIYSDSDRPERCLCGSCHSVRGYTMSQT